MSAATEPRRDSQTQRILAVLADGQEHSCAEIHQQAGFSRLNSRIAELRSRGHTIRCRQLAGKAGPEAYLYQLDTRPIQLNLTG